MIKKYLAFSIILGFILPAAVYLSANLLMPVVILISTSILWLTTPLGKRGWFIGLALFSGVAVIVYGALIQIPPVIPIISVIFMLSAWTLSRFQAHLSLAGEGDNTKVAERHLIKYFILYQLLALIVCLGAILIQIEIGFYQAILLVMLAFIGLLQLVRWIIRSNNRAEL
jgi:hypothetical protein